MSGPALSGVSSAPSGSLQSTELFNNLVSQLKECHDASTQELHAKVAKLKKERYLDAQKLEEFYFRNQQMKEKQMSLLDAVATLEDKVRARAGPCDRCSVTEEQIKQMQADGDKSRQQNLRLIADLMTERNSLQDENRKLRMELARWKTSDFKENDPREQSLSSSDMEEGMIPDSPVQQTSLSGNNRLKLKKKNHNVRYAAKPLLPSLRMANINQSAREPAVTSQRSGDRVLVPNTCDMMDADQHPREGVGEAALDGEEVLVAETCGLELDARPVHTHAQAVSQRPGVSPHQGAPRPTPLPSPSAARHGASENGSPSVLRALTLALPGTAGPGRGEGEGAGEEAPLVTGGRAKRKKVWKSEEEEEEEEEEEGPGGGKKLPGIGGSFQVQRGGDRRPQDGVFKCPLVNRKSSADTQHTKKSNEEVKGELHLPKKNYFPEEGLAAEPAWSLDPAAALSQYETDTPRAEEEGPGRVDREEPGTVDMDCTFVSHSLLLLQNGGGGPGRADGVRPREGPSGPGRRARDSLAEMFDKSSYGEYESCPPASGDPRPERNGHACHNEEDEEEEEEGEEEEEEGERPGGAPGEREDAESGGFAHVAVVRKREERKKLQGHTCKECEAYYAGLPADERQRKLSACSRHRFRYIPPGTPEHFWEVGFPSTQTCVERGYIREEGEGEGEEPESRRRRRRRPYIATFSPKAEK